MTSQHGVFRPSIRRHAQSSVASMWYDVFSYFYDRTLEDLYAPFRPIAVEALEMSQGACVLDMPCGTGQSFDFLVPAVGANGSVLGVDRSKGMLKQAGRRVSHAGWKNVELHRIDLARAEPDRLAVRLGHAPMDGVLCALGLTALSNWEKSFATLYALLRPGGRFVLLDVYAPEPTRESRMVEFVTRADMSRQAWLPLELTAEDFRREVVSEDTKKFGGVLYVASGMKPLIRSTVARKSERSRGEARSSVGPASPRGRKHRH